MSPGCVHRFPTAALWLWCPNRRRRTTSHRQPACPAPPSADTVSQAPSSQVPAHTANEAPVAGGVGLLPGPAHANVFPTSLRHIKSLFFFMCRCSQNKLKVSFLKAAGHVCSELLRTFFSLQLCVPRVALQSPSKLGWMAQERKEQTVKVMNMRERCCYCLIWSHDGAGMKMPPVLHASFPFTLEPTRACTRAEPINAGATHMAAVRRAGCQLWVCAVKTQQHHNACLPVILCELDFTQADKKRAATAKSAAATSANAHHKGKSGVLIHGRKLQQLSAFGAPSVGPRLVSRVLTQHVRMRVDSG